MLKPVCVPCQRFFRMVKAGYCFVEAMPKESDAISGTSEPDKWTPYKIWSGDKWRCQGCGAEILSGFGHDPISEHYQPEFKNWMTRLKPQTQVNDC